MFFVFGYELLQVVLVLFLDVGNIGRHIKQGWDAYGQLRHALCHNRRRGCGCDLFDNGGNGFGYGFHDHGFDRCGYRLRDGCINSLVRVKLKRVAADGIGKALHGVAVVG